MSDLTELHCRIKCLDRIRIQLEKKLSKIEAEIEKKNAKIATLKSTLARIEKQIEALKNDVSFTSSLEYINITDG